MTLDEAIMHCEEVAKENDDSAKEFYRVSKLETHPYRKWAESRYVECNECADEHRRLAKWLRELKNRRATMGEMCNYCCLSMRNCDDMSICCEREEYEGERCDWFVPMPEQEGEE